MSRQAKKTVSMETRGVAPFCPHSRVQDSATNLYLPHPAAQERSLPKLSTQLGIAWSLIYFYILLQTDSFQYNHLSRGSARLSTLCGILHRFPLKLMNNSIFAWAERVFIEM